MKHFLLVCKMKNSATFKNQFYTQFPIECQPIWGIHESYVFLGSCFSTNISNLFEQHLVSSYSNPFGTQFSPDAIEKTLHHISSQTIPEISEFNNRFYALLFDTHFSHNNKQILQANIENKLQESLKQIESATTIFITLGSAWVYRFLESQSLVGNCHKIPQKHFEKTLLKINEIEQNLIQTVQHIRKINTTCKIIFTVSPVRHLRDGITENTISKAHLIASLNKFIQQNSTCHYFPSFEIFNEELRDHRFFESDLAHPNQTAISYIFQRLIETYGTSQFLEYIEVANQLRSKMMHKVNSTNEDEIQKWQEKLDLEISNFKQQYPNSCL